MPKSITIPSPLQHNMGTNIFLLVQSAGRSRIVLHFADVLTTVVNARFNIIGYNRYLYMYIITFRSESRVRKLSHRRRVVLFYDPIFKITGNRILLWAMSRLIFRVCFECDHWDLNTPGWYLYYIIYIIYSGFVSTAMSS